MERLDLATLQLGLGWFQEQPGGLDRYYAALVKHLPATGIRLHGRVVGSDEVDDQTGGVVHAFASQSQSIWRRWVRARHTVSSLIRHEKIDLIASHFALYAVPSLDRLCSLPHVVHFHGPWAAECRQENARGLSLLVKRGLERAVYRTGDRIIVLSQAFGQVLRQDYGIHADRIRVIPGGIDAETYATGISRVQARDRLGWPIDRPIIFCVRRLRHRMGLESLIEAVARVRQTHPEVLVHIGGKGPLHNELQERIDHAGMREHVKLLGFVPDEDLPTAYRAADVSVVPTEALEGFGLITLESLAAGTPVLVTPVGGLPEAVGGLSRDLIMSGTGAGPIAEGLSQALDGRLTWPSPETCQAYVREHFDWPVIAQRVRDVYLEAIESRQ